MAKIQDIIKKKAPVGKKVAWAKLTNYPKPKIDEINPGQKSFNKERKPGKRLPIAMAKRKRA